MASKDEYAEFIPRSQWGAVPPEPVGLRPLRVPVDSIVVTWTDTDPCSSVEECSERIRELQKVNKEMEYGDIRHHFLVGGDGNIYEGRGWRWQGITYDPAATEDHHLLTGKSIEIAFISQSKKELTEKLILGLSAAVGMSQEDRFLKEKVKLYWGVSVIIYGGMYDPEKNFLHERLPQGKKFLRP